MRDYYAVSWTNLPDLTVTNVLDLVPSEFLFRGFALGRLVRAHQAREVILVGERDFAFPRRHAFQLVGVAALRVAGEPLAVNDLLLVPA